MKYGIEKPFNLSKWGLSMTSCMASVCHKNKAIVVAMDTRLSMSGWTSGEGLVKFERIHDRWFALYAGDNISSIDPIIRRARELAAEDPTNEVDRMAAMLSRSYQEQRTLEATRQILSVYSLDMPTFLKRGKRMFNAFEFTDLNRRINEVDLQCEFLMVGFDSQSKAHLFTVCNPCVVQHHDQMGYWAIGSGSSLALASLIAYPHPMLSSIPMTVYAVCTAKFLSEAATDVGKDTIGFVFEAEGEPAVFGHEVTSAIRKIWEKEGRPATPQGIEERVQRIMSQDENRSG